MKVLSLIFLFLGQLVVASAEDKDSVVYEYKKYEQIDLGDLSVKGNVIAPGDLSVRERDREVFTRKLFYRRDFDDLSKSDIEELR